MNKLITLALIMLSTFSSASAQQVIDIDLWTSGLPNSNGIDKTEPYDDAKRNFKPSIRVFLPEADKATGAAVVACPGGGYDHLALEHEGYDWSNFFTERGIAYAVLKYRMPHGNKEVPISDANEALNVVRQHAQSWNIDPQKVGIMGSSAGGHLATTIATHSQHDTAPNFQILFYPVVTFNLQYTHKGSRYNLIGKNADEEQADLYSNEKQVNDNTPPAIILLSDDDGAVPSYNGVNYYLALKDKGIPASLHVYPSGGHGWGYRSTFRFHEEMLADLDAWLKAMKLGD